MSDSMAQFLKFRHHPTPETAQNLPNFSQARGLSPDISVDLVGDGADPGAADAASDTARPLQKRVLDLNREAASLLEQHSLGTSKRMIKFIQKTWALT
ncbi:hypothetical protein BDV33DRAFT_210993 [Aspergillus novoparasiticus]|uniref:Uncharacterized protein n=1 Tax=Aspergillus novoparasiticus TaxID=986946 RepID=A0A5N6E564_9EURO|nr:hypothetical protein BDV33DRAFT_210993 [Aspergillus novoparasiticus]